MVSTRIRIGAERLIGQRRLGRTEPANRPTVVKDANNIFSLHDIALEDAAAVSFDFFDTLAVRRHLSLDQVFRKTAALAADLVPGDRARITRKIYGARGFAAGALKREMKRLETGDEPCLEAVFDRALEPILADPDARRAAARRLVAAEAEIEARNLEPNPEALPLMRALKAEGRVVMITSDMYLPRWAMERIVTAMGFEPFVDFLFVSAEYGATKAGGGLYPVVADLSGFAPGAILHVGDNWQSDVVMARQRGFRALHYFNAEWHAEAKALERRASQTRSDGLSRAGMRERCRLADPRPLGSIDAVIDQVIGPAAGLFVADILMAADRRGSSDIFFLTRDGTIFQDIAEAARARLNFPIGAGARLRRLATSRSTGQLFGATALDPWDLIAATTYLTEGDFTLGRFLALFDIAPESFDTCSAETRALLQDRLHEPSEEPFRRLLGDAGFRAALKRALAARRAAAVAYLEQERLFQARAPVIADIGYSGTWAKQVSPLFEQLGAAGRRLPDCEFRFFASNRHFDGNLRALHPAIEMVPGFLLDHRDGACLGAALNFAWLEPFFVDPTLGALTGYVRGERIEPVFAAPGHSAEDAALLTARRDRIVNRAVEMLDDLLRHEGCLIALRDLVRARMVRLAERPHPAEVRAINGLSHQRGMKTVAHQPIARRFYPNRLPAKIVHLRDNDYWVQGSLRLSGLGFVSPLLRLHPSLDRIPTSEAPR